MGLKASWMLDISCGVKWIVCSPVVNGLAVASDRSSFARGIPGIS
jgi:hypothetical protein